MAFKVITTKDFEKFFKRLLKKYPSLKNDLLKLIEVLEENPKTGINLGNNLYKIRMAISSKNKGKSGGSRIITYVINEDEEVYLIHIFDKGKISNIQKKLVLKILKDAGLN